ncbi:hypothetical protein [Lichenicola sp.]|uniref:hypothetical protein n=1 Tax=Lichenicola sp. TaxID=2804529 RepID=UPI003AFF7B42
MTDEELFQYQDLIKDSERRGEWAPLPNEAFGRLIPGDDEHPLGLGVIIVFPARDELWSLIARLIPHARTAATLVLSPSGAITEWRTAELLHDYGDTMIKRSMNSDRYS